MLQQLRGRNVTHIGCAVGLTIGLLLGMFAAVGVIQLVASGAAVTLAVVALVGVTLGLGIIGFWVGWLFSPHGPAGSHKEEHEETAH
ncbi:MAG TPA: hypothetical protein VKQ36_12055 [Ktedonobacterales bacterium]|nr:hypothetical protein [Ktedonobacterales bacterium]